MQIKKTLNKVWDYLNGNKLVIGSLLHVALIIAGRAEMGLTPSDLTWGHVAIALTTGALCVYDDDLNNQCE